MGAFPDCWSQDRGTAAGWFLASLTIQLQQLKNGNRSSHFARWCSCNHGSTSDERIWFQILQPGQRTHPQGQHLIDKVPANHDCYGIFTLDVGTNPRPSTHRHMLNKKVRTARFESGGEMKLRRDMRFGSFVTSVEILASLSGLPAPETPFSVRMLIFVGRPVIRRVRIQDSGSESIPTQLPFHTVQFGHTTRP